MSSRERALRHGEIKLLKQIKRTQEQEPKKRKILKREDVYEIENEDDETGTTSNKMDINEVEFRLRNDSKQVQHLLSGSTAQTHTDVTILKLILVSGLYPQVAIGDDHNNSETVKEALFHCKEKSFVSLHPFSIFTSNIDLLQISDLDIDDPPVNIKVGRNVFSTKHQLLIYMSLLETTKAFLVNCIRMPALQTLTLFSTCIQTNSTFTKLVFDSWIEIYIPLQEAAEKFIKKCIQIRNDWETLLNLQLKKIENTADITHLEKSLTRDLLSIMTAEISYSMKRLLAADLKVIYKGSSSADSVSPDIGVNPFLPDYVIHYNSKVGGLQVTSYLTYDCLLNSDCCDGLISFKCDGCEMTLQMPTFEKLQHHVICTSKVNDTSSGELIDSGSQSGPSGRGAYYCDVCKQHFNFTSAISILKHKKTHTTIT